MEIYKKFTFEAAHLLPNVEKGHKCGQLHGHSFTVIIYAEGDVVDPYGWIVDFGYIKTAFKPILDRLDHSYLNEIEGLENPTSENLAVWIWDKLWAKFPKLSKVVVNETCSSGCAFKGV